MARLFDTDPTSDFARLAIPLLKFEDGPDGSVYVWGKATDGTLDRDDQIIDPTFAEKSLRAWFETGANVRVMHSAGLYPAGKGVELVSKDGGQWLRSHVVEPTAVKLVRAGVLSAYSVGIAKPRIIRDNVAKGGRVVDGETVEVSLVDRPANPACGLVLAKMAGSTVELLGGELLGEVPTARPAVPSPAAYAAGLVKNGHATGVVGPDGIVKRDFDPAVGGGVDRDSLPAGDFVFSDERAFPIVTPGDVPDAVSSWGRYEGPHTFKQFKRQLTALATRKGEAFAAKLPAEWSKKRVDAELAKGDKDCGGCGKSYDSDTSAKFCSNCGNKLPKAKTTKAADTGADPDGDVDDALGKAKDAVRAAIGAQAKDPDAGTDPNDAKVSAHLENADNALNSAQHAQTRDMAQDDAVEKAEKAALTGEAPAADDGDDTAALTPVPDMSYGLRRLHDAVCGAYAWSTVKAAHPGVAGVGLDSVVKGAQVLLGNAVRQAATELSAEDTDRIGSLSKAYMAAAALDGVDGQAVAEARAQLVKDFRGANPGAPSLTPIGGDQRPSPAQFRRPFLSAGHANPFATEGQRPRIPDATHVPDAGQFTRGPLTVGHQAPPPENTGESRRPTFSVDSGARPTPRMAPGEGVSKAAAAAAAMRAMHDHLADAYPDCCPMGPAQAEPVFAAAVQEQTAAAEAGVVPVFKAAAGPDLAKMAAESPDVFKAAVAAVVAEQNAELRAEYDRKIADLTAAHDQKVDDLTTKYQELAAQPDPRAAPFRGMAGLEQIQQLMKGASQEPTESATDRRQREFYEGWLTSPDPAQREAARQLLRARS